MSGCQRDRGRTRARDGRAQCCRADVIRLEQALEVCGGGPGGRVLAQCQSAEAQERLGEAGEIGFVVADVMGQGSDGPGAERTVTGGGDADDPAPREHVGGRPGAPVVELFGRHERWCANEVPGTGDDGVVVATSDPEVDDHGTGGPDDDVGRLESRWVIPTV